MDWEYKLNTLTELPKDTFGFIYVLEFYKDKEFKYYVGKKQTTAYKELPLLKSGESRPNALRTVVRRRGGKNKTFEVVKKELNWKNYVGSCKDIRGFKLIRKYVIKFCKSKRELTYEEVKTQFEYKVLEDDEFLNSNILGKFYRGNLK